MAAPVSSKTIENILHNSFYAGRLRHDGLEMPGVHPPIVSTVLFERVQQMLTTRTTSTSYVDKAPYVYRGFFRCACGRGYYPYRKKGHAYYRSGCRPSCLNRAPNMPEHQLDSLVIGLLGEIDFTPSEVDQLADLAPKVRGDAVRDQETAAQTALRERAKLTRDLAYLEDNKITLLREGVYDAKSYSDDKARISGRLALLDNPPEIVASDELLKTARGVLELVRLAKACYKRALDHEKQQMLAAAFLELVVTDGEVKEIKGRDHVDVLVRSMVVPSGRPKYVLHELLSQQASRNANSATAERSSYTIKVEPHMQHASRST